MDKKKDITEFLKENITGSLYFKWSEALYLPRWKLYALPDNNTILDNIARTANKLDSIRTIFNAPIIVTSWWRPAHYNFIIGGSKLSSHIQGLAVDFIVKDIESLSVRIKLKDSLKQLGIRMEGINTPHVHIDLNCDDELSNDRRFFRP